MISADAIMCYACGHRLHDESAPEEVTESDGESEIPCPACGTMISGDAIMCYACGHRLGGDDEKGAKKAPMSVKKVLKKKVI
jgi:DNA-directed RNA polymerase subunit RPC12/RpoP